MAAINDSGVSVIIPSYNSAAFLPETLKSVMAQTNPVAEILVVDDGSTDDTEQVVARYSPKVTYIRQSNQGVSAARNLGFEQSRSEWVCFLDADDVWHPNKVARQLEEVRRDSETLFSFTGYYLFGDKSGNCLQSDELKKWDRLKEFLVPTITILPSTAMVRRSVNVRFPQWAKINEDTIYFNELSEIGQFVYLDEPLVGYRKHPSSAQANPDHVLSGCKNMYQWAVERSEYDSSILPRLLGTFVTLLLRAKWKRDWHQYWIFRNFVLSHWKKQELPPEIKEHIFPPLIYRIKDICNSFINSHKNVYG